MGWGVLGDIASGAKDLAGDAVDFVDDAADDVGQAFDDAMDAAGDAARGVGNAISNASISDIGHTALDVAGMVPVIGEAADLANAGWYLAEGDKANAALSAASAIPFAGNIATGAKWVKKGADVANVAADGTKATNRASDTVKAADDVGDVTTTAVRGADDGADVGSIRNVNPRKVGEPGPGSGVPNRYENCANCVVATDSMLSGSPASALPGLPTSPRVLERQFGSTFKNVGSQQEIADTLLDAGPGARGIVHGMRDDGRIGHVFNGVNQNGVVRFLDGQTGKPASFEGYEQFRFMRTN
ncbi:MAG: toxin glutamine deamidase domain-containing protein [Pseudomonadota bacterium]